MRYLTEQQIQILEALAVYRHLTNKQILRLGIVSDKSNLTKAFKNIRDVGKQLVISHKYGVDATTGKVPYLHNLTEHGAKLLVSEFEHDIDDVRFPKDRSKPYLRTYYHRVSTIDAHINFRLSVKSRGFEIDFFDYDFDHTGSNRKQGSKAESKTKINLESPRFLIPDAIGRCFDGKKHHLFLIEIHNGSDTKKLMKQLSNHMEAMELGTPQSKYKHNRGHQVLVVFEKQGILRATAQRMSRDVEFSDAQEFFLFKTLEQLETDDFFDNWLDYNFQKRSITDIEQVTKEPKIRVNTETDGKNLKSMIKDLEDEEPTAQPSNEKWINRVFKRKD